jgi:hypothetical protein
MRPSRLLATTGLLAVVALCAAAAWYCQRCGSIANALEALQGRPIVVDARVKSFGEVEEGSRVRVEFRLRNVSHRTVRVLGGMTTCTCTMLGDLPLSIGPMEEVPFPVSILLETGGPRIETEQPPLNLPILLYTNVPSEPELLLHVTGRIVPRAAERLAHVP